MKTKILKATMLGFLALVGMSSASQAQFEINNAKEEVKVSSIPFVVALRKIVPIDYDFSFETNSDLSQMVSYTYGSDWQNTLSNMLSNLDLDYKIENDVVKIYSSEKMVEEEVVPVTEEVVEVREIIPAPKEVVNMSPAVVPVTEEVTLAVTEEVAPVTEKVVEVAEEVAPVTEKVVEVAEEVAPVTEEVVEVAEEVAPVTEEVVEKDVTPVLESVEVNTPVVEEVTEDKYVWEVKRNFTLQETIKSWGEQVEWNVVWDSDRDFDIQSEASFKGTFVDAASGLIKAFEDADPPVVGTFYKNNTLVIETTSNGEVN